MDKTTSWWIISGLGNVAKRVTGTTARLALCKAMAGLDKAVKMECDSDGVLLTPVTVTKEGAQDASWVIDDPDCLLRLVEDLGDEGPDARKFVVIKPRTNKTKNNPV